MFDQKKGMSDYFSHVIALAIAFLILALIATSVHDYYIDITVESQRAEAVSISEYIGKGIMDMYSEYRGSEKMYQEEESMILASTEIKVPDNIAGRSYNIRLNSSAEHWIDVDLEPHHDIDIVGSRRPTAGVIVEISGFPQNTHVHHIYNIELELEGNAHNPERIRLEYIREVEEGEPIDRVKMTGL